VRLTVIAAVLVLAAGQAGAAPYETFIEIVTEEDLYDLQASGQIDDDTFETLLALYQEGVDLNQAGRAELYTLPNLTYEDVDAILTYREEAGWIADPALLVQVGALSEDKLLAIAPFLIVRDPDRAAYAVDGWVRAQTRWSAEDDRVPPMALQTRISTLDNLTVGVAATITRNRLGAVHYDPNRDALSAEAPHTALHLPKAYAEWEDDHVHAIVGTYRIGFGQRLTFDNTDRYTPNGIYRDDQLFRSNDLTRECKESAGELAESPCAGPAGDVYVTPDFRWRQGLMGAAAGVRRLEVGGGELQAYGFLSYQPRSIYQYELYDPRVCDDPRDDDNPACSAPNVYKTQDDLLAPTSRFSFQTLPDLFRETLGGGNLTFAPSRRVQLGVTGYAGTVDWLHGGPDLDFQEWSRLPFGGPFGAVGVDAAFGHSWADVFVEVAHSFDDMEDGGGGLGAIVRGVATWGKHELEASGRYYQDSFANPYARPISQPDELDGLRARDEAGGRLRFTGLFDKKLSLRASADVWTNPGTGSTPKMLVYARTDIEASKIFRWGVWADYKNLALGSGGDDGCPDDAFAQLDENGFPIACAREQMSLSLRGRWQMHRAWNLAGQLRGVMLNDQTHVDEFRKDVSAWAIVTGKPAERFRYRGRVRYLFQDFEDNMSLEQSLWIYQDLTYRIRARDRVRIRYDLFVWLDDRASTAARVPSPEHWLWLEYESRF
jgi:hypothetical protein